MPIVFRILLMYMRKTDVPRILRARRLLREQGYPASLERVEAHWMACGGSVSFDDLLAKIPTLDRIGSDADFDLLCAAHLAGWLPAVRSVEDLRHPDRLRAAVKSLPPAPPAPRQTSRVWLQAAIVAIAVIGAAAYVMLAMQRSQQRMEEAEDRRYQAERQRSLRMQRTMDQIRAGVEAYADDPKKAEAFLDEKTDELIREADPRPRQPPPVAKPAPAAAGSSPTGDASHR